MAKSKNKDANAKQTMLKYYQKLEFIRESSSCYGSNSNKACL